MAMGSLSWGNSDVNIYEGSDLNNPNLTFARGPESQERPFFAKLSGAYDYLHRGVQFLRRWRFAAAA